MVLGKRTMSSIAGTAAQFQASKFALKTCKSELNQLSLNFQIENVSGFVSVSRVADWGSGKRCFARFDC